MLFPSAAPLSFFFFFLMIRQPPRSTLFPYSTLSRSLRAPRPEQAGLGCAGRHAVRRRGVACWRRLRNAGTRRFGRSGEHTSELQSLAYLVCRLLLEKK